MNINEQIVQAAMKLATRCEDGKLCFCARMQHLRSNGNEHTHACYDLRELYAKYQGEYDGRQ